MTLGGLAGAARCRLASRRSEEHRGHDRRQIVSCGWVSIHLVVNDEITKDRTRAHSPAVSAGQHVSLLCGRPGNRWKVQLRQAKENPCSTPCDGGVPLCGP